MNTPNPELMHLYGTDAYYLEKVGALPDVLKKLAPAAWLGFLVHEQHREEELKQQAAILNMLAREAEAERMAPVLQGFYGHDVPRNPGPSDQTDPSIAIRALQNAKLSHVLSPNVIAERVGASLAVKEANLSGILAGIKGLVPKVRGFLQSAPKAPKVPGIAGVTGAGADAVKKPWMTTGTKAKILGTAVIGGLGYMGYKGLQKANDYANEKHHAGVWDPHAPNVATGVSEYGHAVTNAL